MNGMLLLYEHGISGYGSPPASLHPYFTPLRFVKHQICRNVIRNSKNIFPIIRNF